MLPLVRMYVEQLTEKEKQAMEIAKRMLGSSFCLEKSIGYLEWLKKKNTPSS
jgi:hypothetical protein